MAWINKRMAILPILTIIVVATLHGEIYAQSPCPPGAVPIPGQGRCGSPAEASSMNSRGQGGSQRYAEVWEDRFGAIAVDYKNERSGAAENQKTKHAAERAALKDCASRECKVVSWVRNSCLAVAYGGGRVGYGANQKPKDAELKAMTESGQKGSGCEVIYSECSLPVRVK